MADRRPNRTTRRSLVTASTRKKVARAPHADFEPDHEKLQSCASWLSCRVSGECGEPLPRLRAHALADWPAACRMWVLRHRAALVRKLCSGNIRAGDPAWQQGRASRGLT